MAKRSGSRQAQGTTSSSRRSFHTGKRIQATTKRLACGREQRRRRSSSISRASRSGKRALRSNRATDPRASLGRAISGPDRKAERPCVLEGVVTSCRLVARVVDHLNGQGAVSPNSGASWWILIDDDPVAFWVLGRP